jgi:hypothetical protein
VVELGLKKTICLLEGFNLKSLASDGLFRRFDGGSKAIIEPTTRLVILYG